jgi:glycosyltransferase involved in cell wall biosynthesis
MKNKNKITISIGIPAFNEAANIKRLISAIQHQVLKNIFLEKIIVSSDGSKDNTTDIVKSIKDKKILLIENQERKGLARGLNQIVKKSKSDILVLLDADVLIKDRYLLEKMSHPIIDEKKDLVSCRLMEIKPKNFFEETLFISMRLKENLFNQFLGGNNLFNCHGPVRAFSKQLYTKIYFPDGRGNDMYSYLFTKANGYEFKYLKITEVLYKLPKNIKDHKKQSLRFYNSLNIYQEYFSKSFVRSETRIPIHLYIEGFIKSSPLFIKYPLHVFYYVITNIYMKLSSFSMNSTNDLWSIAKSSKKLHI